MTTLLLVINLALTICLLTQVGNAHSHLVEHMDRKANHLRGVIMSEVQAAVDALVAQLRKATGEVQAKIADLNVQIADAGVADKVDLTELTAAVQMLDDITPDAENHPPF